MFDGRLWEWRAKVHMVALVFLVECSDLVPEPGSEMSEARFFAPDVLPEAMAHGHARAIPVCIELAQSGGSHVDPASSYGLDLPMHQRPAVTLG
jgi:hypothetical protein